MWFVESFGHGLMRQKFSRGIVLIKCLIKSRSLPTNPCKKRMCLWVIQILWVLQLLHHFVYSTVLKGCRMLVCMWPACVSLITVLISSISSNLLFQEFLLSWKVLCRNRTCGSGGVEDCVWKTIRYGCSICELVNTSCQETIIQPYIEFAG